MVTSLFASAVIRPRQTRQSGRNSRPISADVAIPRIQSEFKVVLFLFASCPFLANNLRFMVKLIDKAFIINVNINKNERIGFVRAIKKI